MQQNLFYFPQNIFHSIILFFSLQVTYFFIKHVPKFKYKPGLNVNLFCDADRHVQFLPCTYVYILLSLVKKIVLLNVNKYINRLFFPVVLCGCEMYMVGCKS